MIRTLNHAAVAILMAGLATGCSRTEYRLQADAEVYDAIAEKNVHSQWEIENYGIEMDPRSRFFEPFDPDRPPMPPDDPVSHEFMHHVDGKEGWDHWLDFGERDQLENPQWRERLGEYVELNEEGEVKLTLDSALKLAYMHSPDHQQQLETLYLSSLDVTTERFRLDTQYFGGVDTVYRHDGRLRPENNLLTLGRGNQAQGVPGRFGGGANLLRANRRFASAGELLVGLANSFAWEFTNGDVNFAGSLINASLVQPLLRGAGRDVALEQLTIVERALLGNVRAYYQFRQGFFTRVAIGDQGVGGLRRRGGFFGGTGLTGFTGQGAGGFGGVGGGTFGGGFGGGGGGGTGGGQGFAGGGAGTVGGFIGLLQQLQQIRNSQDSLAQQLSTLNVLEAHLEAGVIDLTQVDQFRQSIETERATLLQSQNGFRFGVEGFLTGTLGLPPKLPVELDDSLIEKFQLVAPNATSLQDAIANFQNQVGSLPDEAEVESIRKALMDVGQVAGPVQQQLKEVKEDLRKMEDTAAAREEGMSEAEVRLLQTDRKKSQQALDDLQKELDEAKKQLTVLKEGLNEETKAETIRGTVVWLRDLHHLVQGSTLIQARARLEAISVETIHLDSETAVKVALANRIDWMNGRASLVDSWRLIAFNADALQANVTVAATGNLRTSGDNPIRFDGRNSTATLGVQFDAPFTRLLERNNYRQSLIDYQRSRRAFIQGVDGLELGLRGLLRQIEQLRVNLEIQRRAVAIAIRRVDKTREDLNAPVPPPAPGQRPAQFGPTAATSLLTALSDLRNTQNNFMSVWLNYHAARMRLARNLGLLQLDENGKWIDQPLPKFGPDGRIEGYDEDSTEIPPELPAEWIDLVKYAPEKLPESVKQPTKQQPLKRNPRPVVAIAAHRTHATPKSAVTSSQRTAPVRAVSGEAELGGRKVVEAAGGKTKRDWNRSTTAPIRRALCPNASHSRPANLSRPQRRGDEPTSAHPLRNELQESPSFRSASGSGKPDQSARSGWRRTRSPEVTK